MLAKSVYPRTDTISYTPTDADYDPATGIMTITHAAVVGAFGNCDLSQI